MQFGRKNKASSAVSYWPTIKVYKIGQVSVSCRILLLECRIEEKYKQERKKNESRIRLEKEDGG